MKHLLDDNFDGATAVFPADVNADGAMDFVAAARYQDEVAWWQIRH